MTKKYHFYIGIDTGVTTGFALWSHYNGSGQFMNVESMKIHQAMERVKFFMERINDEERYPKLPTPRRILIRVEDARKRKWFGESGREKLQGAGSVKRDAVIWEDYLTELRCWYPNMDFEMVAPANNNTKMDAESFRKLTGFNKPTSNHARDAGMLVFGF